MIRRTSLALAVLSITAFALAGCNQQSKPPGTTAASSGGHADHDHEHGDHAHSHAGEPSDAIKAELARLSPEDRASVEEQRICPVSRAPLGSMGPPPKVDVDGRTVWICCAGCQEPLLNNSEEYLAKLDSQ